MVPEECHESFWCFFSGFVCRDVVGYEDVSVLASEVAEVGAHGLGKPLCGMYHSLSARLLGDTDWFLNSSTLASLALALDLQGCSKWLVSL